MMYANIIVKQDNDSGNGKVASVIHPFLATLVEPLALKYPQWEFKESNTNYESHFDSTTGKHVKRNITATAFTVYEKREELGMVYVEDYNRQPRYCVDNFRIGAMRERGSGMKTIHLKKALRHVEKYFGKKNLEEKIMEAKERAKLTAYQVHTELARQESWGWNGLVDDAKAFILSKYWEEFSRSADPKRAQAIAEYPQKHAEAEASKVIYSAVQSKTEDYYLVNIEGMRYSIYRANTPIQVKESEELPALIKRSVGMLKLLEDRQIIGGVGMRVDAETFIVLPQEI